MSKFEKNIINFVLFIIFLIFSSGFKCQQCNRIFKHIFQVLKHERIDHYKQSYTPRQQDTKFNCLFTCKQMFSTLNSLLEHMRKCRRPMPVHKQCICCNTVINNRQSFIKHNIQCLNQRGGSNELVRLPKLPNNSRFHLSRKAFKAFVQQYELFTEQNTNNVVEFFTNYRPDIEDLMRLVLNKLRIFKIQFCLACTFSREIDNITTYCLGYFVSRNFIITETIEYDNLFAELTNFMDQRVHEFEGLGSGYILYDIDRLDLRIGYYNPFTGSGKVVLPKVLANKKAILNIETDDQKCFLWSVCAALFTQKISNYKTMINYYKQFENRFNLEGINFPMKLTNR